jgi:hypothetical protein
MESLPAFLLAPPPLAVEISGNVNPSENPDAQEGFLYPISWLPYRHFTIASLL